MLASFLILESNRSDRRNKKIESNRIKEMSDLEERKIQVTHKLERQSVLIHELTEKLAINQYS